MASEARHFTIESSYSFIWCSVTTAANVDQRIGPRLLPGMTRTICSSVAADAMTAAAAARVAYPGTSDNRTYRTPGYMHVAAAASVLLLLLLLLLLQQLGTPCKSEVSSIGSSPEML